MPVSRKGEKMSGLRVWVRRGMLMLMVLMLLGAGSAFGADPETTEEPVETVSGYPYATVTRVSVNLREKKSVRSALIKKIPQGAEITVYAAGGTWAEVSYEKYSGYVMNEFIVLKKVVKVKATATPTAAPTLSPEEDAGGYKILQSGSNGRDVTILQEALIELGYLRGEADGKFGAATENAVIQFQVVNEYPTTGIMDANIQAFLFSGKPKNPLGTAAKIKTVSPVSGASMKQGNTGTAVAELQSALKKLGFYQGEINYQFDAATKKAVLAFQKKNGLKADGVAGAETQKLLYSGEALSPDATPTPSPTPSPTPIPKFTVPGTTVKLNSTGEDAKLVQQRLYELGYYKGRVDGKFGQQSVRALRKFQEAHGLKADGIAGTSTYEILFSITALKSGATATPIPDLMATPGPTESAAPDASGDITLRQGDGGDAVAALQERLIALGYLKGTADGNYGEKTTAAVRAFQRVNGLTVDGSAGPKTLAVLNSVEAKPASAAATATPTPTASSSLRQGDSGNAVKSLQSRLIALGYLSGKADGVFGSLTYQAVLAFQKANKLTADGVAGEKTQEKLASSSAVAASGSTPTATPAPTTSVTASAVTSKPTASQVRYANWYTTVKAIARRYPYATIYDYTTGISWQIHIFSLGAHADYEPLTANDTARMERVFGGNTWNPRAVWVVFADGSVYMASTHSMPHETQHITDNNFGGHSCLHFPRTQEEVNAIGRYATSHQETIDAGWAKTQSMIR